MTETTQRQYYDRVTNNIKHRYVDLSYAVPEIFN